MFSKRAASYAVNGPSRVDSAAATPKFSVGGGTPGRRTLALNRSLNDKAARHRFFIPLKQTGATLEAAMVSALMRFYHWLYPHSCWGSSDPKPNEMSASPVSGPEHIPQAKVSTPPNREYQASV